MAYTRILVPFDGEPEADEALDLACRLARDGAGSVQALYVARPTTLFPWGRARRAAAQACARIQSVAARHGIAPTSRSIRARRAGPAIVAAAANQDTVVLATHRRRGLGGILSHERTWRYVARHAPCRVLTIGTGKYGIGATETTGDTDTGSLADSLPEGHQGTMAQHSQHRRPRVSRWIIALGGVLGLLGLIVFTPLQAPVQQAILLGPDSLFPPAVARSVAVVRNGRRVMVSVRPGIVRENLTFRSAALDGRLEHYSIYLPPGYDNPASATRRYPVLYLLNGAPGQPSDWLHGIHVQWIEDQGVATGRYLPLIMVMPEANGGVWHDSQYVNTVGGFRAEDLITHDVVSYIDGHYRTIPNRRDRIILGVSEGGYGAMNLGLKHRDEFGTVVSISGYFAANPAEVVPGNDPWGHDWALMAANSPLDYLHRLAGLRDTNILILDSVQDGGYTRQAIRFAHALAQWHIPHTLILQQAPNPLVAHYWPYWREAFPTALAYITRHVPTTVVT